MGITVVVPAYNEEESVQVLLASIHRMVERPDEVIVVDAGSTDDTYAIATHWSIEHDYVHVVKAARMGPGSARNAGVAQSGSDLIAFIDCGMTADERWLQRLHSDLLDNSSDVVFGSYEPVMKSWVDRTSALCWIGVRAASGIRGPIAASSLVKREVIDQVGGFSDHRASEDLDFVERIQKGNYRVGICPDARVYWSPPSTLRAIFGKFRLYSYHNLRARRARHWHYGVGRTWAGYLLLFGGGFIFPLLFAVLGLVILSRGGIQILRRRRSVEFDRIFRPDRLIGVTLMLFLIDAATLAGALDYYIRRR